MSIQWMDNFGSYGLGRYDSAAGQNFQDGTPVASIATGGSVGTFLVVNPDGMGTDTVLFTGTQVRYTCPTPVATLGVAARFWLSSLPSDNNGRCALFDMRTPANDYMYKVIVEPNGAVSVYYSTVQNVGAVSGALATTGIPAIFANSWVHFEFKVDITTGDFELRREGSILLTGTHGSPPGGTIGNFAFSGYGVTVTDGRPYYVKDMIMWDTTGSQNNNFVGPCAVFRLPVDSDVSSGWAKSTGSSDYELLDESPPNDADYISAEDSPLPAPSIMGFANLPDYIVGVRALQTMVRAWKTDGGDANLQVSLISEGDEDAGADRNVSTTPTYWWDISELSPDTAAPWNPIEVNNATIKINRTA